MTIVQLVSERSVELV